MASVVCYGSYRSSVYRGHKASRLGVDLVAGRSRRRQRRVKKSPALTFHQNGPARFAVLGDWLCFLRPDAPLNAFVIAFGDVPSVSARKSVTRMLPFGTACRGQRMKLFAAAFSALAPDIKSLAAGSRKMQPRRCV
jgi:hypothetical protein